MPSDLGYVHFLLIVSPQQLLPPSLQNQVDHDSLGFDNCLLAVFDEREREDGDGGFLLQRLPFLLGVQVLVLVFDVEVLKEQSDSLN